MRNQIIIFLMKNQGSTTSEIRNGVHKPDEIREWITVRAELDKLVREGVCHRTDIRGLVRFYVNNEHAI